MAWPKFWYPRGAGGMWVNYLIWCNQHQTTVAGNPYNFDWPTLHGRPLSGGETNLGFMIHNTDPVLSDICLGSHNAWYNFFLYINIKKDRSDKEGMYSSALRATEWRQKGINFNLDWTLIWLDPEQFIQDLNSLWPFDIQYNEHTQRAVEQYHASCIFPDIDNEEFQRSDLFKHWHQALIDYETDPNLTMAQRQNQSLELIRSMYFSGRKK
jgi:hypothetical protein